ncbi:MAG: hypothetical protein ACLU7D_04500 [Collinsella sp.]
MAAVLSCGAGARAPVKRGASRTARARVTVGRDLRPACQHYDDPAEIGPDRIADAGGIAPPSTARRAL